jgi:hypothetical protein
VGPSRALGVKGKILSIDLAHELRAKFDRYLGGYVDAANLYQLWITEQRTRLPDNKPPFCPASVGLNKFADTYVRYIEANPAKLDVPAATTLLEMLTTDYRCPTPYAPLR